MVGYKNLADYHGGDYECDYVSPWSKSAHNVNAELMIVGHDWSSDEWMKGEFDKQSAARGYSDRFPTNTNLFCLLDRHFGLSFRDVYATNAFPFVKKGKSQGSIDRKHMLFAAQVFLRPQIEIIRPLMVICLGKATFAAVLAAYGATQKISNLEIAISTRFSSYPEIRAVAHTGRRTTNQRGRAQVERDWRALSKRFDELRRKRQALRRAFSSLS